jgi:dihydrodipicolinate synthase/N-acetylneuraminate lyase
VPVLEGVIVALLTPVDSAGQVDHGALRALTERLVARGVTGISPLGSTGEGFSLGLEQRLAVTDTVAGAVPAGMPVFSGVFAHNHEQAVAEIAAYAAHGASQVLAAPPAYYPLTPAEQLSYFSRLADETALPLVLYNIPVYTKIQIAPQAAAVLAAHPSTTPPHYWTPWLSQATRRRTSPSSPAPTPCSCPTCCLAPAAPSAPAPTWSRRRYSPPTRQSWQAS